MHCEVVGRDLDPALIAVVHDPLGSSQEPERRPQGSSRRPATGWGPRRPVYLQSAAFTWLMVTLDDTVDPPPWYAELLAHSQKV